MHFQYLIEDQSSAVLIDEIMLKIMKNHTDITYDYKEFRGIGGFTKKNTVKETKIGKLLNDLATYLRGFNKSLSGIPAVIIVIGDNDTDEFRRSLENVANQNMIIIDRVFCIAVEEVEAWLLGDEAAILAAYPNAQIASLHSYIQDSICGTWEVLADVIYPDGMQKIRKNHLSYIEIGKLKSEWSKKIGVHMDIYNNQSPSFNSFISEIEKRVVY